MGIAAVEDFLIAQTRERFGKTLRTVDTLPQQWGADALRRVAMHAPCVYFAYIGGKRDDRRPDHERAVWHAYVFTADGEESQRRRGDVRAPGAYFFVEALKALLDGLEVPACPDALTWLRTENLFDDVLHANAVTGYRLACELLMPDVRAGDASLDAFLLAIAAYDRTQPDGRAEATDTVDLPQ